MQLHAICVMSNHWHAVVSDPQARIPEFLERAHRLIAKAQNAALGRWENFWSSDKPSIVLLASEEAVVDKMAYVIANPTASALVRSPHDWPGLITRCIGESTKLEMPDVFFDDEGELPDEVLIEHTRPAVFEHLDDLQFAKLLFDSVARRVREARKKVRQEGKSFLGASAVLNTNPTSMPGTETSRRSCSPRVAARNRTVRTATLRSLGAFVKSYREALRAWREGTQYQPFPTGTYWFRVRGLLQESLVPK